ncbi:MAG: 30S ribosomal protein S6 [Magnetococcales bacterium]|nr:30S ribosomal protein S6 [Magnetococcales bacterium]
MAFYESIYIVRPDLTTEQLEQVNKRINAIIADNGGEILQTELWGRRQLAYQVKKNSKGYYVFNLLQGGGSMVANLESRLKIDEDILKYLNVRVDKADRTPTPLSGADERSGRPQSSAAGSVLDDLDDPELGLPEDDDSDDEDRV